jgi:hypothetical protein
MALDANTRKKIAKMEKRAAIERLVELSKKQSSSKTVPPTLDLVIPNDVYQAFLALHGDAAVGGIVKQCRITIERGAKVYFVTDYVNEPREINRVFLTQADVDAWVEAIRKTSKN